MSRSYRKHHILKPKDAFYKNWSNRLIRNVPIELTDTLKGCGYKRIQETWNICDVAYCGDFDSVEEKEEIWWKRCYLWK